MATKYGVIGWGKMGRCLKNMLIQRGEQVIDCCEAPPHIGGDVSMAMCAHKSDVLLLAIPPKYEKEVSNVIRPYIRSEVYIIFTSVDISFAYLSHLYQKSHHITRACPTIWCGKGIRTPYLANYDDVTDAILSSTFGSRSIVRVKHEETFQGIATFLQSASMDNARKTLDLIYDGKHCNLC